VDFPTNFIEYKQATATQSNVVSATINSTEDWAEIAFVIAGSSGTTTTTSTSSSTISISTVAIKCFSRGAYDATDSVISSSNYECSATLLSGQSVSQYLLRTSSLYGSFVLTVNATQSVTVKIIEGGSVVFSQTGTSITYKGSIAENELLEVTIANQETTKTTYNLGLDF
jgi:hypothetical protein